MGKILGGAAAVAMMISAGAAMAQEESDNRIAAETDWSVFVETDPTACWAVSTFKESVNTRDGRVVAVRRGKTLLMVSFVPSAGVNGQVSFTGGYAYADGSTVQLQIGNDTFNLMTVPDDDPSTPMAEDEFAWAATPEDDARIIAAMKRGAQAVVSARSARGTNTKDTFSLLGFTAAVEEARKRCAG